MDANISLGAEEESMKFHIHVATISAANKPRRLYNDLQSINSKGI
jgi:hypothetical protein